MTYSSGTRPLWAAVVLLLTATTTGLSLGPHECALLVNRHSRDSVELANHYAHLRQIPSVNVIQLDLPDKALEASASFTAEEFRELIYEPVQKTLRERNIAGHVLAWLYSADFPAVIETTPPMSLTGMTFVHGRPPESGEITSGQWLSPLFAGPDTPTGKVSPPTTLEEFTLRLRTNMPLPSMMISWTGSRGLTTEQAIEQLEASVATDGSHPSASVFFEQTDDVRSKTRSWQFDRVVKELSTLGVAGFIVSNAPARRPDIMGIMAGRPSFNNGAYGALHPGAYADHLTSFAAVFDDPDQRKLTEWLRLGASGSSGTVTEPGSLTERVALWAKFPHARMFTHYASGCTLIESLFLSIRSPLQILLVGDALSNPWAKPPGVTLVSMADDADAPVKGKAEYLASSWGGFGQAQPTAILFLDGRPTSFSSNDSMFSFDTERLHDGSHTLRVVTYSQGPTRHQGFNEIIMQTRNRGRETTLSGYDPGQEVDIYHPLLFQVRASGEPVEAAIIGQERVLARAPYTNGVTLAVPPFSVGAGPVTFQAVTVYRDNRPVRSDPLTLRIGSLNEAPRIERIVLTTNSADEIAIDLDATDEDEDTVAHLWYADLLAGQSEATYTVGAPAGDQAAGDGVLNLAAEDKEVHAVYEIDDPSVLRELRTTLRFADGFNVWRDHRAGIVFNYRDSDNYMYWGIDGGQHAWVLERVEDGTKRQILSRGDYIRPQTDYTVMILSLEDARLGFFVNEDLTAIAPASFAAGKVGLAGGKAKVQASRLLVNPPEAFSRDFETRDDSLAVNRSGESKIEFLYGGARDVQYTVTERVLNRD